MDNHKVEEFSVDDIVERRNLISNLLRKNNVPSDTTTIAALVWLFIDVHHCSGFSPVEADQFYLAVIHSYIDNIKDFKLVIPS